MTSRTIYTLLIIQSALAVAGSLYYSNFGDPVYEYFTGTWLDASDKFDPCQLCWWARIMMYPILPLSILGLIKKSRDILTYIFLISIPGLALESYHYALQKTNVPNPFGCTASNPCSALMVDYFGFITIPLLAFTAFTIICIISGIGLKKWKK